MKMPEVVMGSPLEGLTTTVSIEAHVRFGRWFRIRQRLGFALIWLALRVLGSRVEIEWEPGQIDVVEEETHRYLDGIKEKREKGE